MSTLIRNVLAVVAGFLVGSAVNLGLIQVSGSIIPPPPGADTATMEGLRSSMHLMEPQHFLFPFLAHALGALGGAGVAAAIAVSHRMQIALGLGCLFLVGGIAASLMLPAPAWFVALDLLVAYLPMAWIGGMLGERVGAGRAEPVPARPA